MSDETPAPKRRAQPLALGIVGATLIAASTIRHHYVDPFREALAGLGTAILYIARGHELMPRRGP